MQINLGVHVCELGCVAPHQSPQVQEVGGGAGKGPRAPASPPCPPGGQKTRGDVPAARGPREIRACLFVFAAFSFKSFYCLLKAFAVYLKIPFIFKHTGAGLSGEGRGCQPPLRNSNAGEEKCRS